MVIINDTNIWIDLKLTNIIEKVFLLPYELAVPDILYNDELKDMDGELLEANGIKIIEMTNDEVVETAERSGMTNRVSFNDLTRRLPKEELQLRIKRWTEEVAID